MKAVLSDFMNGEHSSPGTDALSPLRRIDDRVRQRLHAGCSPAPGPAVAAGRLRCQCPCHRVADDPAPVAA